MRKAVALMVLGMLTLSLLIAAGCGEEKTTITTPEGKVTVEEGESGKVTVQGEGGETTYEWSEKPPSEEQLGLPIYPGAQYVPGSGSSGSVSGEEGKFSAASAEFTTDDSFDKVVSWYRDKLGAPIAVQESSEANWLISTGEESVKTVTVTVEQGKVKITLASLGN